MIFKISVFILGSIIGSFLNVCIYRLPINKSILKPSSFCPHCKKPILWHDNIPLLSYLLLMGKCRFCREKISFRYFLVELITAILFLILFNHFGLSGDFFIFALFCSGLLVISFIDIDYQIIPEEMTTGLLIIVLGINLIKSFPSLYDFPKLPIVISLSGAIFGGGLIYLMIVVFNFLLFVVINKIYKLFGKDFYLMKEFKDTETPTCMGLGDVSLMVMIGAFLGWKLTLLTFFIAPFLGTFAGFIILIRRKSHLIPYGPFLSLAAFISLLFGEKMIIWISKIADLSYLHL